MSEIDPELGAAWRAASREQPPAALDDAIRAAARREVGAKPGGFRAAPRWWPLAAAATVAAIAIGIVQMTPPEQVTPASIPAAVEPKQRDVKPDTDKPMGNEPQREAETPTGEQALRQKAELATASSAARPNSAVSNPPAASVARNELQPFPATQAPAEPGVSNAPPPMAAAAPTTAPAPAPAIAARKLAAQSSATGASLGNRAGNGAGNAEPAPVEDAAASGKGTAGMADKVPLERRKDLVPLAPDEWIKRIRRLIAEGKNDDAARELVAFRREYKDRSDSLLPSDLRAFRQ